MADLTKLRRLIAGATEAPWKLVTNHEGSLVVLDGNGVIVCQCCDGKIIDNDRLIPEMRNELPGLLDEIETLRLALAPFAALAADWDRLPADRETDDAFVPGNGRRCTRIGDFRRARDAMGGGK